MNQPQRTANNTRHIDREAAAWLIKQDRGFTAAEQDAFFQWLAADPRHGEWFSRHHRTWKDFNLLVEWKPEHSAEPNPDLLARVPHRRASIMRWAWWGGLAAAASLAIGLSLFALRRPADPAPSLIPLVASAYERHVLEDGSVVELNRGARLEIAYAPVERRVRLLQGEAIFTVAKNKDRPFIVRAGGVDVRAVGTAFNVRLDDRRVQVLVTEGKVRVDDAVKGVSLLAPTDANDVPELSAGHVVSIEVTPTATAAIMPVTPDDINRQLAWRPEMLDFDSAPLGEVVAAFNRHNFVRLEIADAELQTMPIIASIRSDNVDGFVRLLETTAGVTTERTENVIYLHKLH